MNRLESTCLESFGIGILFLISLAFVMYLFLAVHHTMDRICVGHARRYCSRHDLEIVRLRWQPAFVPSGGKRVKTEFTLVQLECLDAEKQRRLIVLVVWPLGFRRVFSDEKYPDSYDEHWPQPKPSISGDKSATS